MFGAAFQYSCLKPTWLTRQSIKARSKAQHWTTLRVDGHDDSSTRAPRSRNGQHATDIGCAPLRRRTRAISLGRLLSAREYSEGAHPRSYPEGTPAWPCFIDVVPRWYYARLHTLMRVGRMPPQWTPMQPAHGATCCAGLQHVARGCNTLYGVATQHAAVAARLYAMPQIV
jgi:hypothetical protein